MSIDKKGLRTLAIAVAFVSFLLAPLLSAQQQDCDTDVDLCDYSRAVVEAFFALPEGFQTSWVDKRVVALGDRTAIALIKTYTEGELLAPVRLSRALAMLKIAFSQPCHTSLVMDHQPRATVFLLTDLERQAKSVGARKQVEETLRYITKQTSGSCGR